MLDGYAISAQWFEWPEAKSVTLVSENWSDVIAVEVVVICFKSWMSY